MSSVGTSIRANGMPPSFGMYATTKEAWDAMYQALQAAQSSILWEVYIFADDRAGHRFVELLKNKALAGCEVKLIVDRIGSRFLSAKTVQDLERSGVEVLFYNPLHFEVRFIRWFMRLWRRNHRKVLIIDEKIAFIGGVNVTFGATDWDDLHLMLEGHEIISPLVQDFASTYATTQDPRRLGERFKGYRRHEYSEALSEQDVSFVALTPHGGSDRAFMRNLYFKALASAKKKITLITPYYVPYKKFLTAIANARSRGVEVEIITPLRSDHRFVDYMSYYFLELSERLGATIYLLPRMNHAKGFMVDDAAGLIGSSNFTHRSFSANVESDVFFTNPAMVKRLKSIIEEWKGRAALVSESGRKNRRIRSGILNWIAQLFREYV